MRKFTAIVLAAAMVLTLAACSSEEVKKGSVPATVEASTEADIPATAEPSDEKPETVEAEQKAPETEQAEDSAAESSNTESSYTKPAFSEIGSQGGDKGAPAVPGTSVPEVEQPETSAPEVEQPETSAPEVEQPETSAPEVEQPEPDTSETEQPEESSDISDPAALLNTVWSFFGEDERFAVTGGDFSSGELIQEAASFALTEPEALDNVIGFPAAEISKIDSAASLMHMMNQNTFTAGAYHVIDSADIEALTAAVKDNIMNRMWMCGFPDKMIAANVNGYLISAFGKEQQINAFAAHLVEAYPSAVITVDEPIL